MRIFLIGVTGYVGGDALSALLSPSQRIEDADFEVTCLVRGDQKEAKVHDAFPSIRLIKGSLEDADIIEAESKSADIVINLASSSNAIGAASIVKGLTSRDSSRGPAGASIVSGNDIAQRRWGEPPETIYDDVEDAENLIELIQQNPKRVVENLVLAQKPTHIKTALLAGPLIYGQGGGPGHQRSIQAPEIARNTIQRGSGFKLGRGLNEWGNIHVHDLSELVALLVHAASQGQEGCWNENGIYSAENGKLVGGLFTDYSPPTRLICAGIQPFGELCQRIASAAQEQGLIDRSEVIDTIDGSAADDMMGHGSVLWGTNAVIKSSRARKTLNWKPNGPSLEQQVLEIVKAETQTSH